jgi:Na+-transporting NADH:ubiquinone oxidoreductase subunit NqrB
MRASAIGVCLDSVAVEKPPMPAAAHGGSGSKASQAPSTTQPLIALAARATALVPQDPRILQIAFLGILLAAGAYIRDFSLHPQQIALTFAAALGTQRLLDRLTRKDAPSLRSATITALSLTLLLRTDNLWALPVAAVLAIMSKFVVSLRGKHLFNPANFGVAIALLVLPGTWISAGQWGNTALWLDG